VIGDHQPDRMFRVEGESRRQLAARRELRRAGTGLNVTPA